MMTRRLLVSITRREFIKFVGFATLSAFAGVGFAGCSESGSSGGKFEPSTSNTSNTPQNTGYKLIYPDWTKPVPDDVIPHIIEIGRKYIEVWAPGALTCYIKGEEADIPAYMVKEGMVIEGFSTTDARLSWIIGDIDELSEVVRKMPVEYFGKDLAKIFAFANNNMSEYGAIFIEGFDNGMIYFNASLIEEGGGKVVSCVIVQDPNNPENHQIYAFHSKDKLDKMMIEILSNPTGYKPDPDPKTWYKIPDAILKEIRSH